MSDLVISYTDPQGVFNKYEPEIKENLSKLSYLHWYPVHPLPATNPPQQQPDTFRRIWKDEGKLRTIPLVDVKLSPEQECDFQQHQVKGLNAGPIIHLMVIESTSLDIFRSKFRNIAREWHQKIQKLSQHTGFLIVFVTNDEKPNKHIISRLNKEFDPENVITLHPKLKHEWQDVRTTVQKQVLDTFSIRIKQLLTEIQKLEMMREIPGWNFGALFAAYESLAWNLEYLNLFEDAYNVYLEVEKQVLKIDPSTWSSESLTKNMGIIESKSSLINLMLSQTASYFDIRRHLLASKISILIRMAHNSKKVASLADKVLEDALNLGLANVPEITALLPTNTERLNWGLKVAKELFSLSTPSLHKSRAVILLMERDCIQGLCSLVGWQVPGVFNDLSLDQEPKSIIEAEIECPGGMQSAQEFQEEFVRITKQSLDCFRQCNFSRSVVQLTIQLANIMYHRNDIEKAWNYVNQLKPAPVELLKISLDCAQRLKLEQETLELSWQALSSNASITLIESAVQNIQKYSELVEMHHEASKWFHINLDRYLDADENGYFIELELKPRLAKFIDLESIVLQSSDSSITFENIKPISGYKNRLYTNVFIEGATLLKNLTLKTGKQEFTHQLSDFSIMMKPLTTFFNANVEVAKCHRINEGNLQILVQSPKEVKEAQINLEIAEVGKVSEPIIEKIKLENFSSKCIELPIQVDINFPFQKVDVSIEFDGYKYTFQRTLDFQLPISVDYQDHYRQNFVYYQFLVEPANMVPLIFHNAEVRALEGTQNLPLEPQHLVKEMTGFKGSPISYLFKVPAVYTESTLSLKYRSLITECQHILYRSVITDLPPKLEKYQLIFHQACQDLSLEVNISRYVIQQKLVIDELVVSEVLTDCLLGINPQDTKEICDIFNNSLQKLDQTKTKFNFAEISSEMVLDIPKPEIEHVHHVSLSFENEGQPLLVGEPILVKLEIETTNLVDDHKDLLYEVDRLADGWSYTGKPKAVFNTSQKVEEVINLVPNRSGELYLPKISISNLPVATEDGETLPEEPNVVNDYVNTRVLVVPERNMLAITF